MPNASSNAASSSSAFFTAGRPFAGVGGGRLTAGIAGGVGVGFAAVALVAGPRVCASKLHSSSTGGVLGGIAIFFSIGFGIDGIPATGVWRRMMAGVFGAGGGVGRSLSCFARSAETASSS
jgi:hypothetical protein